MILAYSDLKAVLKLQENSVSSYPDLEILAPLVQATVESYINRKLEFGTFIEEVSLYNTNRVPLKALPINNIISVTARNPGFSDISITGFITYEYGIMLYPKPTVHYRDIIATVNYRGGYDGVNTLVPKDIYRALLLQTAYEFRRLPDIGANTIPGEGGTISYPELGLLEEVKRTLAPYQHPYLRSI